MTGRLHSAKAAGIRTVPHIATVAGQPIRPSAPAREYGISGAYLGVEAETGAGGVKKVIERDPALPGRAGWRGTGLHRDGPR
jgi:hypothetical protein